MDGCKEGFEAVVAARRRGFTLCEEVACWSWDWDWNWGWGVFAPVPRGVERLEGSSEVKIVAEEGEMRYFAWRVARSASLNPGWVGGFIVSNDFGGLNWDDLWSGEWEESTSDFTAVS